jgi:hypothetical protein
MFLAIALATVLPCSLSPGLMLDLKDAREMAAMFGVPTPIAVFPDPFFGDDHPIVIEVARSAGSKRLVFTTTRTQPLVLPGAEHVTENLVIDQIAITPQGFILGGGTCDQRRDSAEAAINALLHPE